MSPGKTSGPTSASSAPAPAAASPVAAFERLLALPDLLTLNTFVRATGMSRPSAKVTLSRWASRGLVESAGPRTGIYFNRVRDRDGQRASAVAALLLRYPSATLCGASVLHAHGWTTQIPRELHVAVEQRRSYAQIHGVVLHPRPLQWFRDMHAAQAMVSPEFTGASGSSSAAASAPGPGASSYGLRSLLPAWALADAYADDSGRSWHPDEDDLDIPEEAQLDATQACQAMGIDRNWRLPSIQDNRCSRG